MLNAWRECGRAILSAHSSLHLMQIEQLTEFEAEIEVAGNCNEAVTVIPASQLEK